MVYVVTGWITVLSKWFRRSQNEAKNEAHNNSDGDYDVIDFGYPANQIKVITL